MIEKLRRKISLIVLFAISIPLVVILLFYSISYYNNTIRVNSGIVDRFIGEPNNESNKKDNRINMQEIDGVYSISIDEGIIKKTSENVTDEIKEFAIKAVNKNSEIGIIGNYIYKKRMHGKKNNTITITLIESKDEINKINIIFASSIIMCGIGIVLIYLLSKKIALLIVKPVEDTF